MLALSPWDTMGRILVIDHNDSTVVAMTTLLHQDGHEVEAYTSGNEAIATLQGGRAFDVIVTAFHGPTVDGAAVTRAARESLPDACIVVTHQGRADPGVLRGAGACVVLEKPIQYDAMLVAIAACRAQGGHADRQRRAVFFTVT
jgi:CheY-like chemotaxis protein